MGTINDIKAWWEKATVCEKHGWHPPTHVCRLCLHELMVKVLIQGVEVPRKELPPKVPVYDIKDFKKKGR